MNYRRFTSRICAKSLLAISLITAQAAHAAVATNASSDAKATQGSPQVTSPTIDTNGDGKPDSWDANGDGKADAWDTNGNGKPDSYDTDGDGKPDTLDKNEDGKADLA